MPPAHNFLLPFAKIKKKSFPSFLFFLYSLLLSIFTFHPIFWVFSFLLTSILPMLFYSHFPLFSVFLSFFIASFTYFPFFSYFPPFLCLISFPHCFPFHAYIYFSYPSSFHPILLYSFPFVLVFGSLLTFILPIFLHSIFFSLCFYFSYTKPALLNAMS